MLKYTFDCGSSTQGWELQNGGGNPPLLWAVDNTPKIESPKDKGASAGCNLNYNDGKDYCRPVQGGCYSPNEDAISPVFSGVGLTGTVKLRFWGYIDVDAGTSDQPRLRIVEGNNWGNPLYLVNFDKSKMKQWVKYEVNVPNIKGKNNLRFRIDFTGYSNNPAQQGGNSGAGIFVDDLEIASTSSAGVTTPEVCTDGKDNDGNKLIDCADPACKSQDVCKENCTDGKDNDLDDKTDCLDPDCVAAPTCQPPFFSQSFNCGDAGWQFSPAKNKVAFAIDATPAAVTPQTGGCTLNFNNGSNFCGASSCSGSSNRTAGAATWGKEVDATGLKTLTAEYWSYLHGQEPTGTGAFLDIGMLQASTDNFAGCCNGSNTSCPWSQVNCNTQNTKTFLAPKTAASWKKWTKVTVDLKDFVGKKFKLRYRFDALSSGANNLPGWFIDDMKLFASK